MGDEGRVADDKPSTNMVQTELHRPVTRCTRPLPRPSGAPQGGQFTFRWHGEAVRSRGCRRVLRLLVEANCSATLSLQRNGVTKNLELLKKTIEIRQAVGGFPVACLVVRL